MSADANFIRAAIIVRANREHLWSMAFREVDLEALSEEIAEKMAAASLPSDQTGKK